MGLPVWVSLYRILNLLFYPRLVFPKAGTGVDDLIRMAIELDDSIPKTTTSVIAIMKLTRKYIIYPLVSIFY